MLQVTTNQLEVFVSQSLFVGFRLESKALTQLRHLRHSNIWLLVTSSYWKWQTVLRRLRSGRSAYLQVRLHNIAALLFEPMDLIEFGTRIL